MADMERFDNIVEAIRYLEPGHMLGTCLERDGVAIKHSRYELVAMPDGRVAAISFSGNFTFYRGENRCYPLCKAGLYRIQGRDERIEALLKAYDFMVFLESLPEVRAFVEGGGYYVPWALAQHYEFATPMIDLTNELAVAAFFATHYYDRVSRQYLLMKDGIGRIRGMTAIPDPELAGPLKPIGMQPFARPERQDGYAFWIPESADFTEYSFAVEFVQDADVNLRLKTAMMGGADYFFPNEQLSQMASVIRNTRAVTGTAIKAMLKDIAEGNSYITPEVTGDDIERVIKERSLFLVDAPVICPQAMPQRVNAFLEEGRLIVRPAYRRGELSPVRSASEGALSIGRYAGHRKAR